MMKRIFKGTSGHIFFRQFGSASSPPLMILHPSPLSSFFMEPLGSYLEDLFSIVAPDLPGYGNSDPLSSDPISLKDYFPFILDLMETLKWDKMYLYGTATGCQLAIAFALAYPEKVLALVGENACHFEETEQTDLLEQYFPDLKPKEDGSHLARVWEFSYKSCIGFPWYSVSEDQKLPAGFPLQRLNQMAIDMLSAGEHYDLAYRLAFRHERAHFVQALKIPARFLMWKESVLWPYMLRLAAFEMPENVRFITVNGDFKFRFLQVRETWNALRNASKQEN
jgi:pimeloyl-ACP methyl ester carboxylesterase